MVAHTERDSTIPYLSTPPVPPRSTAFYAKGDRGGGGVASRSPTLPGPCRLTAGKPGLDVPRYKALLDLGPHPAGQGVDFIPPGAVQGPVEGAIEHAGQRDGGCLTFVPVGRLAHGPAQHGRQGGMARRRGGVPMLPMAQVPAFADAEALSADAGQRPLHAHGPG